MPTRSILSKLVPIALLSMVVGCAPEPPPDGAAVLRAMLEAHGDHPYALTIVQETVRHLPGGQTDTSLWYEAIEPGRLRIDFGDLADANGVLYLQDTVHVYRKGVREFSRHDPNPLLPLLHDIYHHPVDTSARRLRALGFDLDLVHGRSWEERAVWVVGAMPENERSSQFWVDREQLLVRRILYPVGKGDAMLDARIGEYTNVDTYDQEQTIQIFVDGDIVQEERYLSVIPRDSISPALFDTSAWRTRTPYWEP